MSSSQIWSYSENHCRWCWWVQVIRSNMVYESVSHAEESNMWIGPRSVCLSLWNIGLVKFVSRPTKTLSLSFLALLLDIYLDNWRWCYSCKQHESQNHLLLRPRERWRVRSIVMGMSVSLFACLLAYHQNYTPNIAKFSLPVRYGCGSLQFCCLGYVYFWAARA